MSEFTQPYKQLDRKVNTWCNYTKRLDTYGCGCQHDGKYCYDKSLLDFRGLWDSNNPKKSNILKIKNSIKRLNRNDVVRLGSMTDCFQPVELKEKITYNTIKILNQYRINYLIVTKSSLVTNPEYLKIYDKKLSHFQISITSTNDEKCSEYEKASPISKRIESIEILHDLGFDVSIRLSPFIYQNIDFEILNSIKSDKILIEFLKVNHNVRKWFDIDYSDYSLKSGGYEHLELNHKIELVNKITGFKQKTIGEYVQDHHEYFKNNVNFNTLDCCNLTLNLIPLDIQLSLF